MTLAELLQTLREDILHDRSDQIEGDSDKLWSDTALIRYIDSAQRRFARRSLCIRDATSPVTRFTTVAYQQAYPVDVSIKAIYSIRSAGNGQWINGVYTPGAYNTATPPVFVPAAVPPIYPDKLDLGRSSHDARYNYQPADNYYFDVNNMSTLNPGKPLIFSTDEYLAAGGASVVKLYPIPDAVNAGCVMQMRVARLPLTRLTPQTMEVEPEIPEDYHLDILDYAAYLALRIVDHEDGDAARAQEFEASFDRHVEEARVEMDRKAFAPVTWGFGDNGFSYIGN